MDVPLDSSTPPARRDTRDKFRIAIQKGTENRATKRNLSAAVILLSLSFRDPRICPVSVA